jgi:predicted nucleic acid-binding Zn ribbon protein
MSLLPEHSHCLQCDDPVDEGQEYCSEECRAAAQSEAKKERTRNTLFFVIAAVLLIAITIMVTLG